MDNKLNSDKYINQIHQVFRLSPFAYSSPKNIIEQLNKIKNKAFQFFKEKNFYEAASLYKALIEKSIENLEHVDDHQGIIGEFLFQCIKYYTETIKYIEIDRKYFFKETIQLFLKEDLGFANEIQNVLIENMNQDDYDLLESFIIKEIQQQDSMYKKEKLILLLLKIYNIMEENNRYIETCKLFSPESWERYIYPARKYEELDQYDHAIECYKRGINNSTHYKELIEDKFHQFKLRNKGIAID